MCWEDLQDSESSGSITATATAVPPGTNPQDQFRRKQTELDDDPTEDLIGCLNSMLNWIHDALVRPHPYAVRSPPIRTLNTHTGGRVLVHSERGISRSGAVVVAYSSVTRALVLPYRTALSIAQLSRRQISPNIGFEWQLRVWEGCEYDVFDQVSMGDQGQIMIKRKASYEQWVDAIDKIYDRADVLKRARAKEDYLSSLAETLGALR